MLIVKTKESQSLFVDFPFSMNEVRCHVNHVQYVIYAFVPSFEQETLVFDRPKVNNPVDSVNSTADQFQVV